jgi:large subunit ribosomal protein L9
MKVILLESVSGLGKAGDIKEVKSGYGLNYLLPEGLAELATPQTVKQAERFIAKRAAELEKVTAELRTMAQGVEGRQVKIKTKAENGKLFGSVGREEIAAALAAVGASVEAKMVIIDKPIKEIGTWAVAVDFGHGVKASCEAVVEAE